MKLSRNWLNEFTKIDVSDKEYADRMTMSGSKVEGVERTGGMIKNVVCGRIADIRRHDDSDSLWICEVETGGQRPLTIVTGAQNVSKGDKVPVAPDGSTLPDGTEIRTSKLRGVASEGMLCSLAELGLDRHDFPYAEEDGIFILQEECKPGEDIAKVLGFGDSIVEFEITNNRPDCLSVRGLARESAAVFNTELKLPESFPKCLGEGDISDYLSVEVEDPRLCPRYTARVVKDVKIAPSPLWMRRKLRALGVRPVNNIVDITNYVMLEYGQPMHAFDYSCVSMGKIVVRSARLGEGITTLDGNERGLSSGTLLIADVEKAVGIAGVMGGENSEITEKTHTIVLESAVFNGPSIRRTSISLGLRTDASGRFEKGLDPQNTLPALERACELVELLGSGAVVPGVVDVSAALPEALKLRLEPERVNRFLGTNISEHQMTHILGNVGFNVSEGEITVPSWRADVMGFADIAEEIARFFGYDSIEPTLFRAGAAEGGYTARQEFEREAGRLCRGMGYNEIYTYSFTSPHSDDRMLLPQDSPLRNRFSVKNPLGEDTSRMRTNSLFSMMEALAGNFNKRNLNAKLYELARVYLPAESGSLADERIFLTLGAYGDGAGFFEVKGCVEGILREMRVKKPVFEAKKNNPSYHPGRCSSVRTGNTALGFIGQVHPSICRDFGIDAETMAVELDLGLMFENIAPEPSYEPLPRFPAVSRDIAFICGEDIPVASLSDVICEAGGEFLESCILFDIYTGESIPKGKRSLAFSICFRAKDQTLTDAWADAAISSIITALGEKYGAVIR